MAASARPSTSLVGPRSRSSSPSGHRAATCTSSPTVQAGGTCTAAASPLRASLPSRCCRCRRSSQIPHGSSTTPPTPCWPTGGSSAATARWAPTTLPSSTPARASSTSSAYHTPPSSPTYAPPTSRSCSSAAARPPCQRSSAWTSPAGSRPCSPRRARLRRSMSASCPCRSGSSSRPVTGRPPTRCITRPPTRRRSARLASGHRCWCSRLDLRTQFFTSRGFAVVNVNYAGSSGHGRAYRERLTGQWGILDVADCINAAHHLTDAGKADPRRLLIAGASAGGYTALCALVFHDVFAAGTSYFGIADLETFRQQAPRFQAHQLDRLVGPYPQAADTYRTRSPLHAAGNLTTRLLLIQGLKDTVVPPAQAEAIANTLRQRGIPHTYLTFPEEGHGLAASTS